MPYDWSNDIVIKFLELLETERVIWDVSDNNHKQKHKVHDAWKRLSDALVIPIEELKSKKKSLTATFRPLLKKKNNSMRSGAGVEDIFKPIWFAFDTMERFLGPTFTVDDTVNTEGEDNISKNEVTQNDTTQTTPDYNEEEAITSNPPQKKKTKKIHMDHIISEADKKINDSFATFSNVLQQKKVEADECDLYASLLAKKLRKYPERMRNSIMYKIDGLLLDNPYPDERPSSASTFYSVPYQYTSTPSRQYTPTPSSQYAPTPSPQNAPNPSPQYAPTPSPQYAPTPSPQYAPNPSPQYVPNQNTTVTSEPPIYIRIPEENIRVQEDLGNQIHILSEEVIMPAKISNIITNAYNDS